MLTNLSFLDTGSTWPPASEAARLKTYAENDMLFTGEHEQVFRENWTRLLRDEHKLSVELVLNWPKRISTLFADLLLGETPDLSAGTDDSAEQERLNSILEENDFWNTAYEVALDISRFGTGIFKLRYDKRGIIEAIPPSIWFPVCEPDNIKKITHHVLAWAYKFKQGSGEAQYLKAEIHEEGKITYKHFELVNGKIKREIEEAREELTGVDYFLIRPVHNLMTSNRNIGLDDYSDLDSIVCELEVRLAQISRILDKHADPNMYGDEAALEQDPVTGETTFRGGGKFFPVSPGGEKPGYVTWDAQLEVAFKQLELLMEQFYALSETSAAAFGQLKAGIAESGTALRRLMMAPLAKVNRVRMRLDPAIKDVLWMIAQLEKTSGMQGAVELEDISITWHDGLPGDETEDTSNMVARKNASLISVEAAVSRLDNLEGEQLQEELDRIAADQAQEVGPGMPLPTADIGAGFTFGETPEDLDEEA